jgi:hypothetical protein
MSNVNRVAALVEVLLDRRRSVFERADAAMDLRRANEGFAIDTEGRLAADPVALPEIAPEWRGPEVVQALVEVAGDPNEYVPLWLEAAEALAYIWIDAGGADRDLLARLAPGARRKIEDSLRHAGLATYERLTPSAAPVFRNDA